MKKQNISKIELFAWIIIYNWLFYQFQWHVVFLKKTLAVQGLIASACISE